MSTIAILGMVVNNRAHQAPVVQEVLTRYGQMIMARVGIPSVDRFEGIITLTVDTNQGDIEALSHDLQGIPGVEANYCLLNACDQGQGFCEGGQGVG